MAAFQQAGDFKTVNVNGTVQKNGGNVATCFCAADGRVIHAVGGPAAADRLLQEARWAVDVYSRVHSAAPANRTAQALLMRQAHLAELDVGGQNIYANHGAWGRSAYGGSSTSRSGGDRCHQMMAAQPLAAFRLVRKPIFEELTGERYADDRSQLFLAAKGLQLARELEAPIVFVLYDGHGYSADQYDPATQWLLGTVFRMNSVAQPLQSFVVVAIPTRQLAALTQLAEIPEFELPARSSPAIVITDPAGAQIAALDGRVEPQRLADALWTTSASNALRRADKYAEDGKVMDGLRYLHKFRKAPLNAELRGEFDRQIASMQIQMAKQWTADGRKTSALRLLRRLESDSPDERIREVAHVEIAALPK